jgi:hypothetical protein
MKILAPMAEDIINNVIKYFYYIASGSSFMHMETENYNRTRSVICQEKYIVVLGCQFFLYLLADGSPVWVHVYLSIHHYKYLCFTMMIL